MKIWQKHSWNSSKAVSPVVTESVRLLSIAIMSSMAKTWSENALVVNIHDKKEERGMKLPKFVFISSNPSSYFSKCVLLLAPSCWNHKGKKMQGHEWRQGIKEKRKKWCKKIRSSWRNLFHRFINPHPTGNSLPLNCFVMTVGPMEPIVGLT